MLSSFSVFFSAVMINDASLLFSTGLMSVFELLTDIGDVSAGWRYTMGPQEPFTLWMSPLNVSFSFLTLSVSLLSVCPKQCNAFGVFNKGTSFQLAYMCVLCDSNNDDNIK